LSDDLTGDARTLGGLFSLYANEVRDLDYQTALKQLMSLFLTIAEEMNKRNKHTLLCQLQQWMADLPLYIKGLFGNLSCES